MTIAPFALLNWTSSCCFWNVLLSSSWWCWVCNDSKESSQSLHCHDHHQRLKSLHPSSTSVRSYRMNNSEAWWKLWGGSLKSLASAITLSTTILYHPSNKYVCLIENRWCVDNWWQSKGEPGIISKRDIPKWIWASLTRKWIKNKGRYQPKFILFMTMEFSQVSKDQTKDIGALIWR